MLTSREWQPAITSLVESELDLAGATTHRSAKMINTICTAFFAIAAVSNSFAATVSLLATGSITNEWSHAFPGVQNGGEFRLLFTYSEVLPDPFSEIYLGVVFPDDLTVSLEILGRGVVFQGLGGAVSLALQGSISPGIASFPAISISSPSSNGYTLTLMFSDFDGSTLPVARLPVDYGTIDEYESVSFSIINFSQLGPVPPNPYLGGTASFVAVPEPQSLLLIGTSLLVGISRRQRPIRMKTVEQDETQQPPLAALSSTSPVI